MDPTDNRPRYSVIVPCFNEEQNLPGLAQRLEALEEQLRERGPLEVVLVDDGSRDGTVAEATRLFGGARFFTLVRHRQNLGIGAAVATGIGAAMGRLICTIDADCTYDPLDLVPLVDKVEEGADVVTASPYHPDGEVVGVGPFRLFLSRGLSRCYSLLLRGRIHTYTSCFRAYREGVARRCVPWASGFESVAEMLCLAILQGYRVTEVPSRLSTRRHGASKMRVGREILNHLRNMTLLVLRSGTYGRVKRRQRES